MKYFLLSFLLFSLYPVTAQENDPIPQTTLDSFANALQGSHPSEVDLSGKQYKINDNLTYVYQKPRFVDIFNKIPRNIGKSAVEMVSKPNYPYGLAAIGATAALIPADPWLIRESRNLGENLGLNEAHTYKKLGFLKIIPADVNSAMYFMAMYDFYHHQWGNGYLWSYHR